MSDTVIKVDHLAKKFIISHQRQERYTALRDVMADSVRTFGKRFFPWGTADRKSGPELEEFYALKDVSFEVKQGDRIGIIGRNGAGKSTLLKVLSRITEPTSGRVEITGRVASLLEVGTGFHPELTGRENIFLNGAILGMARAEIKRKFDEIVAFAEVEQFLDTPVKRYSSGMYVRLAFAVAAHLEPEILIVDEVLAVGDAQFQKKCLGKMEEVSTQEGRTVLFVSHNMAAVRQLCNAGMLLDSGKIMNFGTATDCISMYSSYSFTTSADILSLITKIDPLIELDYVAINGNPSDEIELPRNSRELEIVFKGRLSKPQRMDVELRMFDIYDMPLALFSPGHQRGYAEQFPAGDFHISRKLMLPEGINKGEYRICLSLADPNVKSLVEIPRGIMLSAEGTATETGRTIDYLGAGWLFLSSSE